MVAIYLSHSLFFFNLDIIEDNLWYMGFRWFAKRFLHPDVVSIYDYIFLWDEDLGVENFSPER